MRRQEKRRPSPLAAKDFQGRRGARPEPSHETTRSSGLAAQDVAEVARSVLVRPCRPAAGRRRHRRGPQREYSASEPGSSLSHTRGCIGIVRSWKTGDPIDTSDVRPASRWRLHTGRLVAPWSRRPAKYDFSAFSTRRSNSPFKTARRSSWGSRRASTHPMAVLDAIQCSFKRFIYSTHDGAGPCENISLAWPWDQTYGQEFRNGAECSRPTFT